MDNRGNILLNIFDIFIIGLILIGILFLVAPAIGDMLAFATSNFLLSIFGLLVLSAILGLGSGAGFFENQKF